jgi:hypothetical protein
MVFVGMEQVVDSMTNSVNSTGCVCTQEESSQQQKYKNEIAVDGDLSYLNLDWTPVPIIPKFVDIVVNGMSDRLFKVKAYAQDAMSSI